MLVRRILAISATILLSGCAAHPDEVTDADVSELSDEQSFDAYDANDDELARADAQPAASENELTLYAIPAPRLIGLSWKTPGGLARRTLINNGLGLSRSLGHAAVRVSCGSEHFEGSVVDTGNEFREMVLEEKAGLGVLLRTVSGAVEDEAAIERTLDERYDNGRVSFIRFALDADVCRGLLDYARAFREAGVGSRYGFVRPLYREGAGCSAFSMAFLELARLDEPRFREAFAFDVRVPMSLIGGIDNPSNRVTVFELFTTFRGWAKPDEPHQRLIGWDPTKMFTAIRGWSRSALRDGSEHVERRGRALGLVLDRRHVAPRPELSKRTFWAGAPNAPRNYWSFGDP